MSIRWDVKNDKLDPQFCEDIDALFGADAASWAITFACRTFDEQNALNQRYLAGGPLAAAPGHSAHEFGLAIDFAQIAPGGKLVWSTGADWKRIVSAVDKHPRLHGGWKFPPEAPADNDHIQAVKWYAKRAELKAEGKW